MTSFTDSFVWWPWSQSCREMLEQNAGRLNYSKILDQRPVHKPFNTNTKHEHWEEINVFQMESNVASFSFKDNEASYVLDLEWINKCMRHAGGILQPLPPRSGLCSWLTVSLPYLSRSIFSLEMRNIGHSALTAHVLQRKLLWEEYCTRWTSK